MSVIPSATFQELRPLRSPSSDPPVTSHHPVRRAIPLGLILAASVALPLSRPLAAQSTVHGAMNGHVADAAGRPVHQAEVRIIERASEATRHFTTGRDGDFRFALLTPGTYDIHIEALGYRPMRYVGVNVEAGATPNVRIILRSEAPPVTRVDTMQAAGVRPEPLAWLWERGLMELSGGRRLATDATALSPVADANGVEGLPWRYADLMVDGSRLTAFATPGDAGSVTSALALPSRALTAVTVGGVGYDVEASGTGVGLNARSLRGGGVNALRGAVFGGTTDLGGAFILSGPIQRDTAHAIIGMDYQRSESARPAWFAEDDAAGAEIATAARDVWGTSLDPYLLETARLEERASGFGRLDWQLGDRYAISLRAAGSRLVVADPPLLASTTAAIGSRYEATAAQLSADLLARINARVNGEVRISGDVGEVSAERPGLARTSFAGRGLTIGGHRLEPFRDQVASPHVTALLHWDLGAHRLKLGTTYANMRQESQGAAGTSGAFSFGDGDDFELAAGAWRGLNGNATSGNFGSSDLSFFAQDAWTVTDGFAVSVGLRLDRQKLGVADIERNAAWEAVSGLDNSDVRASRTRMAPRLGFRWQLGDRRQWTLEGGAGIYNGLPDRRDLGEALALDEGIEVRSAVGNLGGWPASPDAITAPVRGRTIAMLGPGYEGPRTRRFSFALLRELGDWTAYVRGGYRQTDYLSRRRDLNLPVAPSSFDQHGRPLYGALQQVGTLIVAQPGTNRRFGDFDAVTAIEVTGYSEYMSATAGIERVVEEGISLGLHYTYSRARDNLASGMEVLAPLPAGANGTEWADDVADTDVPHRVIAAAEWRALGGGVRIGMAFRLASAAPFTPGFRDGVDANGDGVAGNDPAFVDGAAPGMDALIAENSCLASFTGAFAGRNSCRGDLRYGLDLRAAFRLISLAGGPMDLVLDAMDVAASQYGPVDRALYLVDRTGTVSTAGGLTTVPLAVNPNFGALLAERSPGPLFRVGLRIGR